MSNPSSPSRPLSFNNGRASPFRRPDSPLGRSPSTMRAATPQGSPLKNSTPNPLLQSPPSSSLNFSAAPAADKSWLSSRPAGRAASPPASPTRSKSPLSPSRGATGLDELDDMRSNESSTPLASQIRSFAPRTQTTPTARLAATTSATTSRSSTDPLSSIPPQHLHTMRESFTVLDRKNTGNITAADVSTQLAELGLDASSTALKGFFPPGTNSLNLATYLNMLAGDLAQLSRQEELLNAFSAFDDDDSGQIDVAELMDALMHTLPEGGKHMTEREIEAVMEGFVGKRMFKKGAAGANAGLGPKKDVFRYGDFVAGIWGGGSEAQVQ